MSQRVCSSTISKEYVPSSCVANYDVTACMNSIYFDRGIGAVAVTFLRIATGTRPQNSEIRLYAAITLPRGYRT